MAIDRAAARRRVRTVTGWVAGGAAALTAALGVAAARSQHANATSPRSAARTRQPDTAVQPQYGYGDPSQGQGFAPPSASTQPPSATSGGS